MAAMTTHEFDQMLAAFSFALERAIDDPPAYFAADRIEELQEAVEELRLSALENEANDQDLLPGLNNAVLRWMGLVGRRDASDE